MRSFVPVFIALAALGGGTSTGLAQQQTVQLEAGTRARLISPTLSVDQQIVRIESVKADTVVFRSERYPVTRSLALSEISAVEVSLGEQRRTGRGAVIGLLAGAAIGGIAGYASYKECVDTLIICGPGSAGSSAAVVGLVGGATGALVGGTIGWFAKSEKWQRVQHNTRVGFARSQGGRAVSISHPF